MFLFWRALKMIREKARAGTLERQLVLTLPIAAFGGTLFTDTVGFFTHYLLDNYLSRDGIFSYLVRIFEIHHDNPRMDEQNFLENAWSESLFASGIILGAMGLGACNAR